ncbi:MAG TPA: zf-HC2 domain-containing protein [Candidatus Dormibacteraeota bacterium]|nr:zf-HC2 domain-containing protein [Candidatus Dormibacteraeota bacterium]
MSTSPEVLACARVRVLLELYVDGDLAEADPALAAAVRRHLGGCPDCRRQHDHAVSVPHRLKALTAPPPPDSLVAGVMRALVPPRRVYRRAWLLLAPEAVLAAFILWYLSGLDGLSFLASSIVGDLQRLAGWGSGTGPLPSIPRVDLLLLVALIALTATAAYHLSVLVQLTPVTRRTARE